MGPYALETAKARKFVQEHGLSVELVGPLAMEFHEHGEYVRKSMTGELIDEMRAKSKAARAEKARKK